MANAMPELDVAQLVAEHHAGMYRYAYRLTGSVHDAEDLTQQAFLIAQRKIGQLHKQGKVRAWLFAIVRNCYLKSRLRRRPVLAEDLSLKLEMLPGPMAENGGDGDLLQDALNRMPDAFRLVLVMYYFEECSYRAIAKRLGMPIGTVMSRLSRAKGHLRSMLARRRLSREGGRPKWLASEAGR